MTTNYQWIDAQESTPSNEGYYRLYFIDCKQRRGYWNGREWRVHKNPKANPVPFWIINFFRPWQDKKVYPVDFQDG